MVSGRRQDGGAPARLPCSALKLLRFKHLWCRLGSHVAETQTEGENGLCSFIVTFVTSEPSGVIMRLCRSIARPMLRPNGDDCGCNDLLRRVGSPWPPGPQVGDPLRQGRVDHEVISRHADALDRSQLSEFFQQALPPYEIGLGSGHHQSKSPGN